MTNEHQVDPGDDPVPEAVSPAKADMIDAGSETTAGPTDAGSADAVTTDGPDATGPAQLRTNRAAGGLRGRSRA